MEWMPPFPHGIAECTSRWCSEPQKREGASVEKAAIIGSRWQRTVFQVHGGTAEGTVLFRKKLAFAGVHPFRYQLRVDRTAAQTGSRIK